MASPSQNFPKKALVTGASGFIGSTLVAQLNSQGVKVRALLRKTSPTGNLKGLDYERAEGELSDLASLARAVDGVDLVFHLAGVVAAADRETFFRHNAEGTANLARAAAEAENPPRRFVRELRQCLLAARGRRDAVTLGREI